MQKSHIPWVNSANYETTWASLCNITMRDQSLKHLLSITQEEEGEYQHAPAFSICKCDLMWDMGECKSLPLTKPLF